RPYVDDGPYSGPVVNSRRQLWSVAGYLGAVVQGMYGMETSTNGIRFQPFVTPWLHNTYLDQTTRVRLDGVKWRGIDLTVDLLLPLATGAETGGVYEIEAVYLNGNGVGDVFLTEADFAPADNVIAIQLAPSSTPPTSMRVVTDTADFRQLFSPRDPQISSVAEIGGQLHVMFDANGESGVQLDVYRNGALVAEDATSPWIDAQFDTSGDATACYTVEAVFPSSGNRSHHA